MVRNNLAEQLQALLSDKSNPDAVREIERVLGVSEPCARGYLFGGKIPPQISKTWQGLKELGIKQVIITVE